MLIISPNEIWKIFTVWIAANCLRSHDFILYDPSSFPHPTAPIKPKTKRFTSGHMHVNVKLQNFSVLQVINWSVRIFIPKWPLYPPSISLLSTCHRDLLQLGSKWRYPNLNQESCNHFLCNLFYPKVSRSLSKV